MALGSGFSVAQLDLTLGVNSLSSAKMPKMLGSGILEHACPALQARGSARPSVSPVGNKQNE